MGRLFKKNVSSLFASVGIKKKVVVTMNRNTYEVDTKEPKNNWLFPAFKGFQNLQKYIYSKNKDIKTFATVGCGPGIDAIGAYYIFHPSQIVCCDIHSGVVDIAKKNLQFNISSKVKADAFVGNLCAPLKSNSIKADIIYANLPNIPFDGNGNIQSGSLTSSFFVENNHSKDQTRYGKYLLEMQKAFLYDAKSSLTSDGSIIINLGGRVPESLVGKMFIEAGYKMTELYSTFKLQTEAEWVLGGYARAENKNKVTFDFYLYDEALIKLGKLITADSLTTRQLKLLLRPFKLSAKEALKRFIYDGKRIGHVVCLLQGEVSKL